MGIRKRGQDGEGCGRGKMGVGGVGAGNRTGSRDEIKVPH